MSGKRFQLFSTGNAMRMRLIAFLLLASIGWTATAEFTHTHGLRTQSRLTQKSIPDSAFEADESVQSSSRGSTTSRLKSAADCLICQLHQNLSQTLLGPTPATASTVSRSFEFNPDLSLHRADFSRSQRGRAPPANL